MASGFIDSLKLVLSDNYEISDSDYKKLSDILLSNGLSDKVFDSGLVQMINLMIRDDRSFPISLNFLKEMWESKHISYNFVKMIGDLLKEGFISLRKVRNDVFFSSNNITKSDYEDSNKEKYVVVYGSKRFNDIFQKFKDVLVRSNEYQIQEGVQNIPKKYSSMVGKLSKLLKNLDVKVSIESFLEDTVLKSSSLSLVFSQTSNYTYKDSDIMRVAKKFIKGSEIKSIEAFKDSSSELFLNIEFVNSGNSLIKISDSIYQFIEELEVQGV